MSPVEIARKNYVAGTESNCLEHIARFLVVKRLPLDYVEDKSFRDLLETFINFGREEANVNLNKFKIPSRRTLVEKTIEGTEGLLEKTVSQACERDVSIDHT